MGAFDHHWLFGRDGPRRTSRSAAAPSRPGPELPLDRGDGAFRSDAAAYGQNRTPRTHVRIMEAADRFALEPGKLLRCPRSRSTVLVIAKHLGRADLVREPFRPAAPPLCSRELLLPHAPDLRRVQVRREHDGCEDLDRLVEDAPQAMHGDPHSI